MLPFCAIISVNYSGQLKLIAKLLMCNESQSMSPFMQYSIFQCGFFCFSKQKHIYHSNLSLRWSFNEFEYTNISKAKTFLVGLRWLAFDILMWRQHCVSHLLCIKGLFQVFQLPAAWTGIRVSMLITSISTNRWKNAGARGRTGTKVCFMLLMYFYWWRVGSAYKREKKIQINER